MVSKDTLVCGNIFPLFFNLILLGPNPSWLYVNAIFFSMEALLISCSMI
jgi:hypothetical protein